MRGVALQLPIKPAQRLRLYIYLGDALVIGNQHLAREDRKPLSEIRKLAVVPYLEGLKDAKKYPIPDDRPQLPGVGMYDVPPGSPEYEQVKKTHDQQMAARSAAEFEQELWDDRRILANQIVELYAREPYTATEVRRLAAQILNDPTAVESLMKLIAEKGALGDDQVKTADPPRTTRRADNH